MHKTKRIGDVLTNLNHYRVDPVDGRAIRNVCYDDSSIGCVLDGGRIYGVSSKHLISKNIKWKTPYFLHNGSTSTKDIVLAVEQLRLIKTPYNGNLDRMLKKARKGKLKNTPGLVEFLCFISEKPKSTEILSHLINQQVIEPAYFLNVAHAHLKDFSGVFDYDRFLHKLVSAINDESYLDNLFNLLKLYQDANYGYASREKASKFLNAVISNPLVLTTRLEQVLYSDDEIYDLVKFSALHAIRDRDEYEAYPKTWLLKMFQLD